LLLRLLYYISMYFLKSYATKKLRKPFAQRPILPTSVSTDSFSTDDSVGINENISLVIEDHTMMSSSMKSGTVNGMYLLLLTV